MGNSVIGGYVYRGRALPDLVGAYFFGEGYTGEVWTFDILDPYGTLEPRDLSLFSFASFGEDACGELYVADTWFGGIYKIVHQ